MKAIKTAEKTHEILFKPYSTDILGYTATFDCGRFYIINSKYQDKANEVYSELMELSKTNFQKFILLQKNGNVYKTDDLNFLEKSDAK